MWMSATFSVQDVMKSGESFHLWPFTDEIKSTDTTENGQEDYTWLPKSILAVLYKISLRFNLSLPKGHVINYGKLSPFHGK